MHMVCVTMVTGNKKIENIVIVIKANVYRCSEADEASQYRQEKHHTYHWPSNMYRPAIKHSKLEMNGIDRL